MPGLNFITKLRPVSYQLNRDKINDMNGVYERRKQITDSTKYKADLTVFLTGDKYSDVTTGFIAQEVEAAAKNRL
ncbi:MAG: tail fiber domain-containing protein [Chitinophagaceae bacterium]|nr:tail fiber domain-containing protein [Chitinophagaceae bacterium]